jgi:hypothetical protein
VSRDQGLLKRDSRWHWHVCELLELSILPLAEVGSIEMLESCLGALVSISLGYGLFQHSEVTGVTSCVGINRL